MHLKEAPGLCPTNWGPERGREKCWKLRREPPVAASTVCSNFLCKTAFTAHTEVGAYGQAQTLNNRVRKAKLDILKRAEHKKRGEAQGLFIVSLPAEWSHNSVSNSVYVLINGLIQWPTHSQGQFPPSYYAYENFFLVTFRYRCSQDYNQFQPNTESSEQYLDGEVLPKLLLHALPSQLKKNREREG